MNRSNSSSSGLADRGQTQQLAHSKHSTFEQLPQSSVIDLADGDYETCDANRSAKRQKLDLTIDVPNTLRASKARSSLAVASSSTSRDSTPSIQGGRPFWNFCEEVSELESQARSDAEISGDELQQVDPHPPLPMRPWTYKPQNNSFKEVAANINGTAEEEVQTTPFRIEVPEAAPKTNSDQRLDFYPWEGSHPEDLLTDQTAKQGFYDRVQVSQNESNTARPSLYAQFKHRSGLKLLSSVFTSALDKRQAHCKVTELSTFKPPPRVTLTDIKREAWLRDLANPSVPLRKLSRTIPHGIRGKILLEQCVNKGIPIGRAVWLAKCVGANEIRAFKRKGTSTVIANGLELKWVRDWSLNVQQFVEGIVGACGTPNWTSTMSYVVRLAAQLFQEQLLDQDLCLDWFLQSLNKASIRTLPVWLLMLGAYWTNLVRYRNRGRRLAEYLLEKLKTASALEDPIIRQPIVDRLSWLIKTFAESHPSCFVLPLTWRIYKGTLNTCFHPDLLEDNGTMSELSKRNERVIKLEICHQSGGPSSAQQLICLLDSADGLNDMETLSSDCLDLSLDYDVLISKILEWVSTSFRRGSARIYVAVRLLQKWRNAGIDTDSHILTFLQQKAQTPGFTTRHIYHVVFELVHSQSFAVSKYLQWLMARGAVSNDKPMHPDVELLTHLPHRRLPSHVWNLRNTLLTRAGFSVDSEIQQTSSIKYSIHRQLPEFITKLTSSDDMHLSPTTDFSNLTWTIKDEIGHWIREHVALYRKRYLRTTSNDNKACAVEISALTPTQFFLIRNIVESLGDLSLLADILKHASSSDDVVVLISAVDTLNYHSNSFKAIGASSDLYRSLLAGYSHVRKADRLIIELMSSLMEVGIKLPGELSAVAMIRRDLSHFDKNFPVTVSSPVSEHTVDSFNPVSPAFPETLHQLLISGNGMDEANLNRIFDMLVGKLVQSKELNTLSHETARYLSQLRILSPKAFDRLMLKWIILMLKSSSRPCFSVFLPSLVGVGCVTLHAFFTLVNGFLESDIHRQSIPNIAHLRFEIVDLLGIEGIRESGVADFVSYRFQIARQEYLACHARDALGLVNAALVEANLNPDNTHEGVEKPEGGSKVVQEFPNCVNIVHHALDILLALKSQAGSQRTQSIVDLIDDFSLPYCLMKLQLLLDAKPDEEAAKSDIVDVLLKKAESDVLDGERRWIEVLSVLPVNAAQLIRQRAERELLDLPLPSASFQDTSNKVALTYLRIVDELSYSIPDEFVPSSMGPDLVDKMSSLLQKAVDLGNTKNEADTVVINSTSLSTELSIGLWFHILLRLVSLYRSRFSISCGSRIELNHQIRLLIQIRCIARSPLFARHSNEDFSSPFLPAMNRSSLLPTLPRTWANLQVQAFDVCSALVDTLPDEARYECARFLRDKCPGFLQPQNDAFLLFLLGPIMETQSTSTHGGSGTLSGGPLANLSSHLQPSPSQSQNLPTPVLVEDPTAFTHKLRFQQNGRVIGSYPPRPWEMLGEAAPTAGINDTPVNFTYFGTRQVKQP
ncbi:RNA polymerase II mediator complex subunit [Emydomyces testavorans]|uniref:Mediator of RNA polymerase II transcription subunit 12 n=1 Tax=Emydomyces testavorans TaxID=2070801 RepID=A0AAF0II04_9EURO|nr:RNA polymerase II mediator complex subunit [Emydomyces testavorans]